MARYILKRIGYGLMTLFIVTTITFLLMNYDSGRTFHSEKSIRSEATMKALEEKYGLDKPLPIQYVNYLKRLIKGGDFGSYLLNKEEEA